MKKHQIYGKDLKKMFAEKRKFDKNAMRGSGRIPISEVSHAKRRRSQIIKNRLSENKIETDNKNRHRNRQSRKGGRGRPSSPQKYIKNGDLRKISNILLIEGQNGKNQTSTYGQT